MKKIITTIFFLSAAIVGMGQSIVLLDVNDNIITNTTVDEYVGFNSNVITDVHISNSTNVSRTYKCRRAILSMAADDSTQFCFGGLCYGFQTNIGSLTLTVAPHDTVDFSGNGFHCDFVSGSSNVTRYVYYRFEDPANTTDSSFVIIKYNLLLGVNEASNAVANISNPSPNPSSSLVSINYNINSSSQKAKLVMYNLIGKEVKQITLNDKQGIAKINTEEMPSGIYFYSLLVDDKMISTKKLVVSH